MEVAKKAKSIMVFVTLFAPFGVYFHSVRNFTVEVSVHAILWGTRPDLNYSGSSILFDIFITFVWGLYYGIFNIWFGFEVIRYFNDYTRKRRAILAGVLSIAYPMIWAIISWGWISYSDTFVYIGPIPIQLVIGLLLMKYFGEPQLHEPWSD
jgi:hypothetical protein